MSSDCQWNNQDNKSYSVHFSSPTPVYIAPHYRTWWNSVEFYRTQYLEMLLYHFGWCRRNQINFLSRYFPSRPRLALLFLHASLHWWITCSSQRSASFLFFHLRFVSARARRPSRHLKLVPCPFCGLCRMANVRIWAVNFWKVARYRRRKSFHFHLPSSVNDFYCLLIIFDASANWKKRVK